MYRLTARQILSIALLSAFFAAAGVACFDRWGSRLQQPTAAFTEADPSAEVAAITDPSVATDERNNIEVFRAISPGVVSINTMTRPRRRGQLKRGWSYLRPPRSALWQRRHFQGR